MLALGPIKFGKTTRGSHAAAGNVASASAFASGTASTRSSTSFNKGVVVPSPNGGNDHEKSVAQRTDRTHDRWQQSQPQHPYQKSVQLLVLSMISAMLSALSSALALMKS
jgi:hypothetical protein